MTFCFFFIEQVSGQY